MNLKGQTGEMEELVIRTEEWEVEPYGDLVLMEKVGGGGRTAGGLVIPEKARDGLPQLWLVLKVGPGQVLLSGERSRPLVCPGDRVLLAPARGRDGGVYPLPGRKTKTETILVSESAIIGKVTEEKWPAN